MERQPAVLTVCLAEVFNSDGSARLATASALSTLNTEVNGTGALADKVDNIAASMFVNGDTTGTLNLATAASVNTITAEVFPNGVSHGRLVSTSSHPQFLTVACNVQR